MNPTSTYSPPVQNSGWHSRDYISRPPSADLHNRPSLTPRAFTNGPASSSSSSSSSYRVSPRSPASTISTASTNFVTYPSDSIMAASPRNSPSASRKRPASRETAPYYEHTPRRQRIGNDPDQPQWHSPRPSEPHYPAALADRFPIFRPNEPRFAEPVEYRDDLYPQPSHPRDLYEPVPPQSQQQLPSISALLGPILRNERESLDSSPSLRSRESYSSASSSYTTSGPHQSSFTDSRRPLSYAQRSSPRHFAAPLPLYSQAPPPAPHSHTQPPMSTPTPAPGPGPGSITLPQSSDATPGQAPVQDTLGPRIWNGSYFLPRFIREVHLDGEGLCYFYDDGTHCKAVIDGEPVNKHWGVTKAGKPRKRLAIACMTCREKKIKCDPDFPACVQCRKFGRDCQFKNAPRGGNTSSNDEPSVSYPESTPSYPPMPHSSHPPQPPMSHYSPRQQPPMSHQLPAPSYPHHYDSRRMKMPGPSASY